MRICNLLLLNSTHLDMHARICIRFTVTNHPLIKKVTVIYLTTGGLRSLFRSMLKEITGMEKSLIYFNYMSTFMVHRPWS